MKSKFQLANHQLTKIEVAESASSTRPTTKQVDSYRCDTCGQTWKTQPASKCPGAPIYSWEPWPDGLCTRRQLADKHLKPGPLAGVIPYEKSADGDGWLRLYRESEATPKPELSAARKAALAKMQDAAAKSRLCSECGEQLTTRRELNWQLCEKCSFELKARRDQLDAAEAAYELVCTGDFVVWDSETTDLHGQFVEIAVVDAYGKVLFDQRIRPGCLNDPDAYEIHGIRDEDLATAPTFYDIYCDLRAVLHDKHWVIYNRDYDTNVLYQEMDRSEYRHFFAHNYIEARGITCAMNLYAAWYGDWHDYYQKYRWKKLSHAAAHFDIEVMEPAHSALGDCLRTLELLYAMADWYRQEVL